jgi:hypothetical protein
VDPAERGRRGQDDDVAGAEAVHRPLVGVKADELAVLGDIDGVLELLLEVRQLRGDALLEDVRHRDQLHRPGSPGGERVDRRPGSAPAATDERQADRIVLGSEDVRDVHPRQRRAGDDGGGFLQKVPTAGGVAHIGL